MLAWGVYFIIFITVFERLGTFYIGFLTLNQFVIIFLFILAIPYRFFKERHFYQVFSLDIALVLFGLYLWISNFFVSPNPSWGMRVATHYLRSMTCYFLVVFLITDKKKITLFIASYILSSLAMVLTADVTAPLRLGIHFYLQERVGFAGKAGHYINYAMYSLLGIPLLYFLYRSRRRPRAFNLIFLMGIALLSIGVLFSGSRGAVLSFLFMALVVSVVEMNQLSRLKFFHLGIFAVISLGMFAIFWAKGGRGFIESLYPLITGKGGLDFSLAGRLHLIKSNVKLFYNHPLLGTGVDASRRILGNVTHSQWLQILSELGVFGMILALLITWLLFYYFISTRAKLLAAREDLLVNALNGVAASILILLVWGLYENIGYIQAPKVLFMLFAGLRVIRTMSIEEEPDPVRLHSTLGP